MKKVLIYYFSGCGNSKWVANCACEKFKEKGLDSEILNIEDVNQIQEADLTGFVAPIYGFGLPKTVLDFFKKFKPPKNQQVFVLTTPAGHEGVGLIQAKVILEGKNCNILDGRSIYMPDSWLLCCDKPEEEKFNEITAKARESIEKSVENILGGKKYFSYPNIFAFILFGFIYVLFYYLGRHFSGKLFALNKKCNSCGFCRDNCPVKSITWRENKPYWGWNCIQCFRCINKCPKDAIEISTTGLILLFLTFFWLPFALYGSIIPSKIILKLSFLGALPKILFWILFNIFVVWTVQFLSHKNLMPQIFLTKKRKRYKIFD